MKTEAFEYEVKKQLGDSCCVNGLLARCKNYPLRKAMVDHDQDRIKPRGRREVGDEVNGELLKGESDSGYDREERGYNGVCNGFVLLADGTASDKVFDKGGEAGPPEIPFQNCLGAKDTHVSRQRGGMDRVEQGRASGRGYEHPIAEIKMSIIERPVGERGMSEQGRALVQRSECFKYEGIGGGGGLNVTGEREIKRVDDHGFRQDGSVSVVPRGVQVISPRESISGSHVSSRGYFPDEIKVLKKEGPVSLSTREFTRILEIG